nr:MAG TPA: hypothetical protein [Bacteriophage sp.]
MPTILTAYRISRNIYFLTIFTSFYNYLTWRNWSNTVECNRTCAST